MENMLNKLRSTVSSAASNAVSNAVSIASQVSNYLPGNPVTREFEATSHIASAGTGLSWKVYSGYKKSSRQDVSLFVFEKRSLDRWERQDRELMLEILRRGVAQLTRIRHPQILTVQHPLEESRDSLAFATEPVLASLSNILGNGTHNMPSPLPTALQGYQLHDVEIKYGFVQVCEGLQFLHQSMKIVHCCLSPENIVVNQQGAWKLFGFDFCLSNMAAPDAKPSWQFPEYRPSLPTACLPPLDYLAPECITSSDAGVVGPPADMFSVGALATAVFNGGRPHTGRKGDVEAYKRAWKELSRLSSHQLVGVPDGLKEEVRKLLQPAPDARPHAQQLSQIDFFCDIGVKTLSYLDQMFQWDNVQKSQFYKGLPQLIPQLPHRVALLRIVPAVVQESVNPTMVPFVLPVVLQVAERATDEEFVSHVLPHLKPIMKITEPTQILVQLMQKMSLLLSKTPASDVRSDVLPLLYRALDTDTCALQEMCLSALPACAKLLDKQTMKAQLLPRVQKLCLATTNLSVRVSCLVSVGRLLPQLDKWLVLDAVVPFITQLPSREAPVIMAAVGILQVSLKSPSLGLTKEVMANKLLPFLLPLTIENCLSPGQHGTLMALVRDMVDRVEAEHKTKLEYLNSIKDEQKTLHQMMPDAGSSSNTGSTASQQQPASTDTDLDGMFAGLGLGQYVSPKHHSSSNGVTGKPQPSAAAAPAASAGAGMMSPTSPPVNRIGSTTGGSASSPRDLTASLSASPLPPPPQHSSFSSINNSHSAIGNGVFSPSATRQLNPGVTSLPSPASNNNKGSIVSKPSVSPALNASFNANFSAMNNNINNNISSSGSSSKTMTTHNTATNRAAGTSAFDNLLPSQSKPKSMNQMGQGSVTPSTGLMNQSLTSPTQSWSMNQGFNNQTAAGFSQGYPLNNMTMTTNNMGVNNMAVNTMGNMNTMSGGMNAMGSSMNTMSGGMNAMGGMNTMGMGGGMMGNAGGMMSPMQQQSMSGNTRQSSNSFKPLSSTDINDLLS